MTLEPCWIINNCGRELNGKNVAEKGLCEVSEIEMGQSCWVVIDKFSANKCSMCEVYRRYNRSYGCDKDKINNNENVNYIKILKKNLNNL